MTQFSNVKPKQHYFNRLSHLFILHPPPLPFVAFPIAKIRRNNLVFSMEHGKHAIYKNTVEHSPSVIGA